MDSGRYSSMQLWTLLSRATDTIRHILLMLRMVISHHAKTFPWELVQIRSLEKIIDIMFSQIEVALWFAVQQFAWLKQYLLNSFLATSAKCIFISGSLWNCVGVLDENPRVVKFQSLLNRCSGLQVHQAAPEKNLSAYRRSGDNPGSTWVQQPDA